ncbi:MAG: hypothetical protein ABIQ74_08835 [Chitinophagales bacterium]
MTDATILELVKKGNRLGIKGLYDKYSSQFLQLIRSLYPQIHEGKAEELLLHVLIRTWINRQRLPRSAEKLYPWLSSILREELIRLVPVTPSS